ncbi:hypothetical protein [Actinophytocola sp. NPDC049390]
MVKRVLVALFTVALVGACGPDDGSDGPDLSRFAVVSPATPPAAGR